MRFHRGGPGIEHAEYLMRTSAPTHPNLQVLDGPSEPAARAAGRVRGLCPRAGARGSDWETNPQDWVRPYTRFAADRGIGVITCSLQSGSSGNSIYVEAAVVLPSPILFGWLSASIASIPPEGDLLLHPLAFAGWVGMIVTMLNLFPVAMLDGGHVSRALFGSKYHRLISFIAAAIALSLFSGLCPRDLA